MSNKIFPIIFFSISESGREMADAIQKYSRKIDHPVYSKFVRFVSFNQDHSITNNFNEREISFPFPGEKTIKQDNYAVINIQRQNYLAVFEEAIGDIKNIENTKFAHENNYEIKKIQIIILSSIDEPNLMPLISPLILGIDSLKIKFHLLLSYNEDLSNNKTKDSRILKNAFLREIETLGTIKPEVWLLDIINEEEINLREKSTLFHVASQFIDLLISNAESIDQVTYNNGGEEQGKPCLYSSIGYSVLRYPVEKAKNYILLFGYATEFKNIIEKFDLKFESILLKDELTKFLKRNGFEETPERLSKKDNSDLIFAPFTFEGNLLKHEKEQVLAKNLSPVENTALSNSITSDHFLQIDESEKSYIDTVFIEFSGDINSARKRELSRYLELINKSQLDFIDDPDKSVNYAILFAAILGNNGAVVREMLGGRFPEDIPTLNTLEDKYREIFIGDEISKIRKELRVEIVNSSNKKGLLEEYTVKLEEDKTSFEKIEITIDADNPKLAELKATIKNYQNEIDALTIEIDQHNNNITRLNSKIEKLKTDFDRDATKENFKIKRNVDLLEQIENIRNKDLVTIDKKLAEKYVEKNSKIQKRKKHIFYNLAMIPLAILLIPVLLQLILFSNFEWFDGEILKIGLGVSAIILSIYYLINLYKFNQLHKDFKSLFGEIGDLLQKKNNLFQKYITNKNQCFKNDFLFETDLISFSMMKTLKEGVSKLQQDAELFRDKILTETQNYQDKMNSFEFIENSFELGVLEKDDLEKIYSNYSGESLFYDSSGSKLSLYYTDFKETDTLKTLEQLIEKKIDDISFRKIENENLKNLLFNESQGFSEINTGAKFKMMIESSRPLLQTPKSYFPNTPNDIPYTENIIIGHVDPKFKPYFDDSGLNINNSIKIEESNKNILGMLSIKSNFPSFLIYDVRDNEELIRTELNLNNKTTYFTSEKAFNYPLMPSSLNLNLNENGDGMIGDDLIGALSRKIIEYDVENKKFFHPIIGDLGFQFDDLINYWNSPLCSEINEEAKEIDSEIWLFDEDERMDYLNDFKRFWMQFKAVIPKNYEDEISQYYFLRKGEEQEWNEIKAEFKKNRKNSR